ncbi:MAG: hypothetical protein KC503_37460 [Myxococcales bacterium]|nr:hypothetical protein [Myxococcales bacterium]
MIDRFARIAPTPALRRTMSARALRREMATLCLVAALLGFVALPAMHLAEHTSGTHEHRHNVDGSTVRTLAHEHDGSKHEHALSFGSTRSNDDDDSDDHPTRERGGHGDGGLAHLSALLLATTPPAVPAPTERLIAARALAPASLVAQRLPAREGAPRGPPANLA